ncbi:unnamed protein product [Adineta ricciae]|uniref:Uncharacterized protein n=1 Tax=Adineta ricciae TaxID=249248 RepID=A0A816EQD7_ADIRI|nr:unnamed protein product [Adineta ricciae]CAF1652997.1 unnamed protein product [Adineta ricciae]
MDESELLNFNWFSEAGYSRLKAEAQDIKVIRDKMIEEGISYQYLPDNVRELLLGTSCTCRENTLNGLSSLSNEQARNYCEKASLTSLTIQEKLDSLDDRETLRGVRPAIEGESSLRYSLDPCCQRYKYIRVILQTVLTLKCLTNEEKIVFKEHLELINGLIDKYEACDVFILVRAFFNGNDIDYDDGEEVQVCSIIEPVGSESIGHIPQFERPGKKSLAHWCDRRNYLCIFDCPKVDFSIYIHKSEIIHIVKLVREQFKSDFDGQYEEEARFNLPHQPLSSSVVYLSKNKQNAKDIQGQLPSGREIIQIDPKDYYVRIDNIKESYGDLERILFQRLVKESSKYTLWFREIINKSGKNITSDHEFVLFAHAKAVSECARNLSTWMINSMCLDVIEKDINLDGKNNTDDQRLFSPWNLFFQHHSMTGESYKNQIGEGNENQEEIDDKEVYIIMNWLCIFWLGNENVTMVNDSDVCLSYLETIQRTKLEAAERYARTCILKMLFHRMYSIDSWDCNHF